MPQQAVRPANRLNFGRIRSRPDEEEHRGAEIVVAGVARDVCVTQAVDGMRERGYRTVAVRDTTWGLGLEDEAATLERWARGGRVVTLEELRAETEER